MMDVDWQAIILHDATQTEAIEFARKEAKAGRSLSPQATKMFADIFDPDVDKRGRKKRGGNHHVAYAAGYFHALFKHGLLKKQLGWGESWKDFVSKEIGVSVDTIERKIYSDGKSVYYHAYTMMALWLWIHNVVVEIKFLSNISKETKNAAIIELVHLKEMTTEQAEKVKNII